LIIIVQTSFPARTKRQTGREIGTQSHGALGARQAAEICNPMGLQWAFFERRRAGRFLCGRPKVIDGAALRL
jgi:hypothetical protein